MYLLVLTSLAISDWQLAVLLRANRSLKLPVLTIHFSYKERQQPPGRLAQTAVSPLFKSGRRLHFFTITNEKKPSEQLLLTDSVHLSGDKRAASRPADEPTDTEVVVARGGAGVDDVAGNVLGKVLAAAWTSHDL